MDHQPGSLIDPKSATGKIPWPDQQVDVLVIGAGPAGIAAALEAAATGQSVLLVDEHPVSAAMAGLDVPYLFGGRTSAALANQARMVERIAANNPGLEAVFDAGIEVLLNVSLWAAWVPGPNLQILPGPIAGLASEDRSWRCGFKSAVVAAGARDLVLSFAGSDQPGIIGAQALHALLTRYQAFLGQTLVILGSGRLALETAMLALDQGLHVAALIEVRDRPHGPDGLVAALKARGVEIRCATAPVRAETTTNGVVALDVVPVGGGGSERIACDTICLAIGLVPSVELFDVLGAELILDPDRGGHVPVCAADGRTSLGTVRAVGDCAGIDDPGGLAYRMDWMRALLATGGADVPACICEDVSRRDLFALDPPHYLGPKPPSMAPRDLASLLREGPPDHDQIKRLTRVSMGPCQARRCREQIAMLLAIGGGTELVAVKRAGFRAPLRPLSLTALAAPDDEAGWDVWFGILSQWVPDADIGTAREAEYRAGDMHL